MLINRKQKAKRKAKQKPKLIEHQKAQKKIEKNGYWIKVEGDFKTYDKFVPNKKKK